MHFGPSHLIHLLLINKQKVLAIIPARGGSKGLPRKNILPLADKPLIAHSIIQANQSKYIDKIILSSEDEEIIKISKNYNIDVPFVRGNKHHKNTMFRSEIRNIKKYHQDFFLSRHQR